MGAGLDETLPSGDETLDAEAAPGREPVAVRRGAREDYPELVPVDPKHFVVGRELARGGIGRITTARDRRLGRTVAIKELLTTSDAARLRFEREARITAQLQHPAIVNLLEAGTWPNGEPFYVMKLVEGRPLDRVIAARATLEQRLALLPNVIAVVDALAFAHSRRVIHRDLKPSNVLVGDYGETVVIDWGLAKQLDSPEEPAREAGAPGGETIEGLVMGTPGYMPIEQARGEAVDERADVYSLGALLYHVLAGAAPYIGKSVDEILDSVEREPPPSLAARAPGLPADLVAIVERAMARDAAERYPAAKALADDLKKFQTGQLVGAHRYTTWQLVRRWLRRHRAAVAVTTIATVVLIVGAFLSVRRIVDEQRATEAQRMAADRHREDADDLVAFMLADLVDKYEARGDTALFADIASKAATYYSSHPPLTSLERVARAKALSTLSSMEAKQDHLDEALAHRRAALAILEHELAGRPSAASIHDVAFAHQDIAFGQQLQGKLDDALAEDRLALAMFERAAGLEATPARRRDVANVQQRIAQLLLRRGDIDGALGLLRAAGVTLDALVAADTHDTESLYALWLIHGAVGDIDDHRGDATAAMVEYRACTAITDRLRALDAGNVRWLRAASVSSDRVAQMLQKAGDLDGAIAGLRSGLEVAEALVAHDPSNEEWQRDLATSHITLGEALSAKDQSSPAVAEFRAGLAIATRFAATDPTNRAWQYLTGYVQVVIGGVLEDSDPTAALVAYVAAVSIAERLVAASPRDADALHLLFTAYDNLGSLRAARGDTRGGSEALRSAIAVGKRELEFGLADSKVRDTLAATERKLAALSRKR